MPEHARTSMKYFFIAGMLLFILVWGGLALRSLKQGNKKAADQKKASGFMS